MRTIKGVVSLGSVWSGTEFEFEFEVPDNATDEKIDEACWKDAVEYVECYIECYWEEEREIKLKGGSIKHAHIKRYC